MVEIFAELLKDMFACSPSICMDTWSSGRLPAGPGFGLAKLDQGPFERERVGGWMN